MRVKLMDAIGMTLTASFGIGTLIFGIVKGGEAFRTFGFIGILFSLIFPTVSIWFWIDYFKDIKR